MKSMNPAWLKLILFVSSFSPLWLIILISSLLHNENYTLIQLLNLDHNTFILVFSFSFILIIIPIILLRVYIYEIKKGSPPEFKTIKKRQNMTGEYAIYFLSYIIPFVLNDFDNVQHIVTLVILFSTYAILMLRSNSIHVNPVLNLWGYKIYKITDQNEDNAWILTKTPLIINEDVKTHQLDEDVYLVP